jgi:NADPH:quinone reductase-like Zn-dependent oxidoreductase
VRAVVIRRHGGPEVLEPTQVEQPQPGTGEALVRVQAVSVNGFLDVANRAGLVPFARYTFPHILGSEHAGEVVAYGPDTLPVLPLGTPVVVHNAVSCGECKSCAAQRPETCSNLRLLGVMLPGAYAEYTSVPVANLRPIPRGCSALDAAAMSLNGPLATTQLTDADVRPGETVLVQAAASSTGTMAAVVARALGCRTIGTTRHAAKKEQLERLGLFDVVLDSTSPHVTDDVYAASGGDGADIVIDNVGAPELWEVTSSCLATRGRIVTSGAMFGGRVELDLARLYRSGQRVIGVRSSNDAGRDRFWQLVDDHQLRPVIDTIHALDDVETAHRRLEAMANVGRVMLSVD